MTHTPDPLIIETLDRLLEARCDSECITRVERGESADELWRALTESQIHRAWVSEAAGGVGASLADVCAIATVSAQHAAPLALADTMLGHALASTHGLSLDDRMLSLGVVTDSFTHGALQLSAGRLTGTLRHVPFARWSGHLLIALQHGDDSWLAHFDSSTLALTPGCNLAGEPVDSIAFEAQAPAALLRLCAPWSAQTVVEAGALLRTCMMSGALGRILAMSVAYAKERVAFGRPIARFQAVQQNLAVLAGEVAAATAASNAAMLAASTFGFGDAHTQSAVASAKIRVGEAANSAAAIAHQVHGAMGFTIEHRLQQFTRRLWCWRDEFGAESTWAIELGRRMAALGSDDLWPHITALGCAKTTTASYTHTPPQQGDRP